MISHTRSAAVAATLSACVSTLAVVVVTACGMPTGDKETGVSRGAQLLSVKSENGKTTYVDTHDAYAHTGKIDAANFRYFKSVGGKPSIALTFDCAWVDEANGMRILDFLKARGIRTTFFISGPFVYVDMKKGLAGGLNKGSYRMIRRMVEDGHEFGNHTQTHPHNSSAISWQPEVSELQKGWNAALKDIFGSAVPANAAMLPFWRAPYGEYDDRSLRQASAVGFPLHFGWNVDSLDSTGRAACKVDPSNPNCLSPAKMTQRVIDFGANNKWNFAGMVVLAHLQNPYDWTSEAAGLARLVDTYQANGVVFRRISEMFNRDLAPDVPFRAGTVPPSQPIPTPVATPVPTPAAEKGEARTTADTWLKTSTADSSTLAEGTQKCRLPPGTVLAYTARSVEGTHVRLNLAFADAACPQFPTKNVFLYGPHAVFTKK